MWHFLFKVFGKRVALLFGGVCFLSVSVLAALYMTSGYALQSYVSEQIERLPWDVTVLQRSAIQSYPQLQEKYSEIPNVDRVEALGFMRIQRGNGVIGLEVEGEPMPARWVSIISTTDPSVLPPQLASADLSELKVAGEVMTVKAALVTGSRASADPVQIDAGDTLRMYPLLTRSAGHHHGGGADDHEDEAATQVSLASDIPETLFEARIGGAPSQMERLEFNKWILGSVGSLSYLPEHAVALVAPMDDYRRLAPLFDRLFLTSEGVHGGDAAPPYLPEMAHLIRLDRSEWVSTWNLGASLNKLSPLMKEILSDAREVTPFSYVNSDLHRVLVRMQEVSQLVGLVTLLVAIPLLWLAWVVARMLSGLLLMNERRMIGLALIRGIPLQAISRTLLSAIFLGGLVGGLLGLVAGLGIPILGHTFAGRDIPPWEVIMAGVYYFPIFIGLGIALALFSGRGMIKRIRKMTPREAMARVSGSEFESGADKPSAAYLAGAFLAVLVGGYKIASWLAGRSIAVTYFRESFTENQIQNILVVESLLNFVAIPLFLFGIIGLLRWRLTWFQYVLNVIIAPMVGRLRWFIAEHMALSRYRIAGTLFLTSLAMSLTLLPQVAADSFYDRILRGVQASLGTELQLEYSLPDLAGGEDAPAPVPEYNEMINRDLATISSALNEHPDVSDFTYVQQYVMPGVYLPAQSGLILNLFPDPGQYRKVVYFEESIGLSKPFSSIVASLDEPYLTTSQGFLKVREVPLRKDVILGYTGDYQPITAQFDNIVAFFPGQPSTSVAQREGYVAAEVDYLNYVMSSDARVFAAQERFARPPLNALKVLPSRIVFLVNTRSDLTPDAIEALVSQLPIKPQNVRTRQDENQKISKDMFISLALGNMNVFMIGGLILAVSGVFVIGLANFIAERRTFSLLRLRGLPKGLLLRVSLAMFLVPVIVGIVLGILLGAVSGYGIAQAIWELPRIYGVAGFLDNELVFSLSSWMIVLGFGAVLALVAIGFGLWPFRKTAREAIKEG